MSSRFERRLPRIAGWIALLLWASSHRELLAQELDDRRVGVFAGYTFSDSADPGDVKSRLNFQGGNVGVYVAQTNWLRWRADGMGGSNGGILGPSIEYAVGGPEFTKTMGRAKLYAHGLFGWGEVDGGLFGINKSGFAMALGGGVDVKLNSRFSARVIEVDYLPSHFSGLEVAPFFEATGPSVTGWESNLRVSAGIVVKFGHKP